MIEVILKEPVDHLGAAATSSGSPTAYARNYLLPRNLALQVTAGNQRQIDAEKKRAAEREAEERTSPTRSRRGCADRIRRRPPRRREGRALRLGHLGRRRRGRSPASASRSTSARSSCPIRSARWASTRPVRLHRDVTAQVKVLVVKAD